MKKFRFPKITSATLSYNGNTQKFDSFVTTMIKELLDSDWKPQYVDLESAIPIEQITPELAAKLLDEIDRASKKYAENFVA